MKSRKKTRAEVAGKHLRVGFGADGCAISIEGESPRGKIIQLH